MRSANVERDGFGGSIEDYVPTSRTLDLLERVLDALDAGHGIALSVIGPYGSGKSSAVLFLRALFSEAQSAAAKTAHRKLLDVSPEMAQRVVATMRRLDCAKDGIDLAFATSAREPIAATLTRALSGDQHEPSSRRSPSRTLAAAALQAFEQRANNRPLLLVLDEFGKTLEHFAEHAAESDLFILQQVAERAVSTTKTPTIFITLQHLAFEEYLSLSTPHAQREWAKVQGRFGDFSFAESTRQTRKLIGAALERAPIRRGQFSPQLLQAHVKELTRLGFSDTTGETVSATWPLHPLTVMALPELCAKFAQNERTLFSFLRSDDPAALPQFQPGDTPSHRLLLGLDGLFDYFVESARSQLMAARGARRWLEVESRIADAREKASAMELAVLKAVGVLNLITAGGVVRASQAAIEYACLDNPADKVGRRQVGGALDSLVGTGLLTYRNFADEYRIWAGSDFDLSAAFERARLDVSHASVSRLLQECRPRLPIVAGRFSAHSGSIRAFECIYADSPEHLAAVQPTDSGYDGVVAFWVAAAPPASDTPLTNAGPRPVVLVEAKNTTEVRRAVVELAAYQRVLEHSPQLQNDWVARRELTERLAITQQRLDRSIWQAFDQESARTIHALTDQGPKRIARGRLSSVISTLAQARYASNPRIANEVINRQHLTSQGASARRTLIEAMLTHSNEENLGIKGFGPEQTIYIALLKSTGIHRIVDGQWQFGAPANDTDVSMVWSAVEEALEVTHFRKLSLAELFRSLSEPPYGMRQGPLPVLLTAFLMARPDDTALYEHGTYQPNLTPELLERLAKNPANFEVRSFALRQGSRLAVIEEALREFRLPISSQGRNATLVSVVRPILNTFRGTPDYARNTRRLSPHTLAVRSALTEAREPDQLLFSLLPQALGLPPIGAIGEDADAHDANALVGLIRTALRELTDAFPCLLARMRATMAGLLGVDESQLRLTLRSRAERLVGRSTGNLSSFLIASADPMNPEDDWLQRLGTALVGKAPKVWRDEDEVTFEARVRECIGGMHRLEFLFGDETADASTTYRVCLTLGDGTERVFVGTHTAPPSGVSDLATNAIAAATTAAGPAGPAALVRILIERLAQEHTRAATLA